MSHRDSLRPWFHVATVDKLIRAVSNESASGEYLVWSNESALHHKRHTRESTMQTAPLIRTRTPHHHLPISLSSQTSPHLVALSLATSTKSLRGAFASVGQLSKRLLLHESST